MVRLILAGALLVFWAAKVTVLAAAFIIGLSYFVICPPRAMWRTLRRRRHYI